MRLPIQYALSYPERLPRAEPPPDLARLGALHFETFSSNRWPCVGLAQEAMASGGTAPAVLNAADEVAVEWFLRGRIRFTQIPVIIESALDAHTAEEGGSIEALIATDGEVREFLSRDQDKWTKSAA
jgi:1-deoxy-D-xylulose-5-phosphate reductoisomerase